MGTTPEERAERNAEELHKRLTEGFYDQGGFVQPMEVQAGPGCEIIIPGMTLLDHFAGQALAGELAYAKPEETGWRKEDAKIVAERCYAFAEAMVAEKRRREGGAK